MDHKALLAKYMEYVMEVEGSDFVHGAEIDWRREGEVFTEDERGELEKIARRNARQRTRK